MMTAMLTVENIDAGARVYNIWNVNEDAEYHEAGDEGEQHVDCRQGRGDCRSGSGLDLRTRRADAVLKRPMMTSARQPEQRTVEDRRQEARRENDVSPLQFQLR